jgi:hypothetical protein
MNMRYLRILLLLVPVIFFSCAGNNNEFKNIKLIPEEELVSVMTDIYLSNGLLGYPPVRNLFISKDSIENYIDVIVKHGYTKEQMDKTMKYYFIEDTKELEKIYDQVLVRLTEIQSGLETVSALPGGINLWNQKDRMSVPENGAHDLLYFSIPVKDTGLYEISFTAIIHKDDQSVNPRTSAFFWHSSETQEGVRDLWDNIDLIRDGTSHSYSVIRKLTDTTFTHISGWLFQCDAPPGSWVKHGTFSSISVRKISRTLQ